MSKDILEKLKMIYDHFGDANQRLKLLEEIDEYLESYTEEELGDIFVIVMQLYINSPKMRNMVEHKIDRTINRIEEGYYSKEGGIENDTTDKAQV